MLEKKIKGGNRGLEIEVVGKLNVIDLMVDGLDTLNVICLLLQILGSVDECLVEIDKLPLYHLGDLHGEEVGHLAHDVLA